jgi:predicted transposase YbfD/YdcC
VVAVHATRQADGQTSRETRYFISSLDGDARALSGAIRSHWAIENSLHWSLDVAFREDESRVRAGDAAENLAVLRHIALNVLKQDSYRRCGLKAKRLKAGWDDQYLEHLLAQI